MVPRNKKDKKMKKRSWSKTSRHVAKNSGRRAKRLLKKLRAKRARRSPDEFRKTYAWALD